MPLRLGFARIVAVLLMSHGFSACAMAQESGEPSAPSPADGADTQAQAPLFPQDNHRSPERTPQESTTDAVLSLNELRGAVRTAPGHAPDRLKLARALYVIGDLDAALDESRTVVKLSPNDASAHLQLGVILMAKQDWRAAATALTESVRLDPALAHGHYSLGTVQYSLGNLQAAIRAYRQALDLQPHFPDARYRLALVLKLANQPQAAARFMEEAAVGGVPQAQYFMGNAYRNGHGVGKDLALAIRWWMKASESGQQRASEALSLLRRQGLSGEPSERRRKDVIESFRAFREGLWGDYPDTLKGDSDDSLGVVLLNGSQATNGLEVLLLEAAALGDRAVEELAALYEHGLDTRLAPFDPRILHGFETLASDGFAPAKKALARIYAKGLGLTADRQKAKTLLKGLPKADGKAILDETADQR